LSGHIPSVAAQLWDSFLNLRNVTKTASRACSVVAICSTHLLTFFLWMWHSSTYPPNVQICHDMWSVLPGHTGQQTEKMVQDWTLWQRVSGGEVGNVHFVV